jgi:ribosome-binding protein aMBF1 (putative translation factor)
MNTIDHGFSGCQNSLRNGKRAHIFLAKAWTTGRIPKQFAALMRKVEAVRIRYGMTKIELAAELGANVDGVRAWMTGRTIGRKETVAKIEDFLKRKSV